MSSPRQARHYIDNPGGGNCLDIDHSYKKNFSIDLESISYKFYLVILIAVGIINASWCASYTSLALILIGILLAVIPIYVFRLKKAKKFGDIPLIVLLLRHGESTANRDPSVYETTPDHIIPLSERLVLHYKFSHDIQMLCSMN